MKIIALAAVLFLTAGPGFATDYGAMLKSAVDAAAPAKTTLGADKLAAGLKEALKVGVDNAVKLTGRKDGYFADAAIKILMPEKAKRLETGLRKLGFGRQMDEFVLSMNRAAEKAAPAAREIFVDALTAMTIDDARRIYDGGDTAATQYFQTKTRATLKTAYRPIVRKAMRSYRVTEKYEELTDKIPFSALSASLNIEDHVVDKALDGLFKTLGDQEREIRKNPAARVTALLKEVFSRS
jgi:hypothetical protein